ncbi:MAG: DUF4437 domain-containing protein [Hyphomicrobium sp.]
MTPSSKPTSLITALAALAASGFVAFDCLAADEPANASPSTRRPVSVLEFGALGVGVLKAAPAYGDRATGQHGTFVKIPAGFSSPVHAHTADFHGVVINGVIANGAPEESDTPLAPGSYWFQPAKRMHVTKCLSQTECVIFLVQPGKFDFVPAPVAK